jgi:hypothetical protein
MRELNSWIYALLFWAYVIVKTWGVVFASWSWWWVLAPIVPWLYYGFSRVGLV